MWGFRTKCYALIGPLRRKRGVWQTASGAQYGNEPYVKLEDRRLDALIENFNQMSRELPYWAMPSTSQEDRFIRIQARRRVG